VITQDRDINQDTGHVVNGKNKTMPYRVKKQGDKYVVYKKDTGDRVGATAGNKEALRKYLAALHINAKESVIKLMDLIHR
jgi:hypothetical protein